jgi:hypothetical protein
MWPYKNVNRKDFENRKNFVDEALRSLGCKILNVEIPYDQTTTMLSKSFNETWISERPIYQYENRLFRIDEVLFENKPFIVIENADTIDEVMKNIMEDANPFPYDLSDIDTIKEIKYVLGIESYTNN